MKPEISDTARNLRSAYQRSWRRRNPDKMRQYTVNYWEKKAQIGQQFKLFEGLENVKK